MNTINGRTPEEIKKGLECCSADGLSCLNCSYCVSCDADIHALERDALAYIQQLEDGIRLLRAYNKGTLQKIVQLERERDAAVEALCKIHDILFKHGWTVTPDCVCEIRETIVHAIVDVPHTEVE